MFKSITLGLMLVSLAGSALAGVQNDVPSCYAANPKIGHAAPAPEHELFVLIDQTTLLDPSLRGSVFENTGRFVKAGNSFTIGSFSSFSQGRYMSIENAGTLEVGLSEQEGDALAASVLKSFNACINGQAAFAVKMAGAALNKAFSGATSTLAKSDVMASIKELSIRVKASPAKQKIVFIVSDMLENSSISSFYAAQNVRKIDPNKELTLADHAKMFGDFGGARVFVLGAGIVSEDGSKAKGVYRDPQAITALKEFWQAYFKKSNAELVEFGAPALMVPVQ